MRTSIWPSRRSTAHEQPPRTRGARPAGRHLLVVLDRVVERPGSAQHRADEIDATLRAVGAFDIIERYFEGLATHPEGP